MTAIALLFGPMSSIPVSQYVSYVAAGMIVWNLIVSMFTESCQAFNSVIPVIMFLTPIWWMPSQAAGVIAKIPSESRRPAG